MNNLISNPALVNFINKIRQLYSPLYKHKKQKYMQAQQQFLENEELFNMSVELLKENLELDQAEYQQFCQDEKFIAYIRSIEKVGLMLSKFYLERESDHQIQIQTLKDKNNGFQQKLTHYMDQNQGLKELIQRLENDRNMYDEILNKSEHQLERGKHQILNQINANEHLLKENQILKSRNEELSIQISNLKQIIEEINRKHNASIQEIKRLNAEVFKSRKQFQKTELECIGLKEEKFCFQREIECLQMLIEQKDYMLGNRIFKEGQQFSHSAQHNYHFFPSSFKVVKQENESGGSDKEVMGNIEQEFKLQPIMIAAKFAQSRSISVASQKSETSICLQSVQLQTSNEKQTPNRLSERKILKTDRKRKDSSIIKQPENKSCSKMSEKSKEDNFFSATKALFLNNTPDAKERQEKQKSMTYRAKKQDESKEKLNLQTQRNASAQNNNKIKNKKFRTNASVILNPGWINNEDDSQFFLIRGKIEHSQSVEDFYGSENTQYLEKEIFQKEILTRQKLIQSLKSQNKSVRRLAQQESQKRTQAEHEYEQCLQKLKEELNYFKTQLRKVYAKYIQQKALSKAYEEEFKKLEEQFERQKELYETDKQELKDKCKFYMQQQIAFYREKYEEVLLKMKQMELSLTNNDKDEDISIEEQNAKQLKKSKSNSLFYKEVKHHSYNASQEYSEINQLSANHSKNASFINIDDEEVIQRKNNNNIFIKDCEQYDMEEEVNVYEQDQLYSYNDQGELIEQEILFEDRQVQTQNVEQIQSQTIIEEDPSKISLQYSSKLQDSSQISYEFSSLGLKSSEDHSKTKFVDQKLQKGKRLSICPIESVIIQGEKSGMSDFDTLEINSKNNESSLIITADLSYVSKFKISSFFKIQSVYQICVYYPKLRHDKQLSTERPHHKLFKSESVLVKPTKLIKILGQSLLFSQTLKPHQKQTKDFYVQHEFSFYQDREIQTVINQSRNFGIQSEKTDTKSISTQVSTKILTLDKLHETICKPIKKPVLQYGIQCSPTITTNFVQTTNKYKSAQIQTVPQFQQTVKKLDQSTQTFIFNTNFLKSTLVNETIFPFRSLPERAFQQVSRNDHNQSFNEDYLNEVLLDMSQSFQMSEKFIQTLKKKLLQIHENLRQLEEEKQHNESSVSSQQSSSSLSSNNVEKVFKNIEVADIASTLNKLSTDQSMPRFHICDVFEGNVQTSKASTNCSVSTSFSFLSPYRHHETQEAKFKVTQFQEIQEIQSEYNVDSLARIQCENTQINVIHDDQPQEIFEKSSFDGSVNRSPTSENIMLDDALLVDAHEDNFSPLSHFMQIQQEKTQKIESGKKFQQNNSKKLSGLLNSPKSHFIHKQKLLLPSGSSKSRLQKNLFKSKTEKLQKCKQLDLLSKQEFEYFCLKYKPRKMKLVGEKGNSTQMSDESTDVSDDSQFFKISSKELLLVFCEPTDNHPIKKQLIVIHQSRILSLRSNFQFQASKVILSHQQKRLVLGNHEVTLTETQLKFAFQNKVNYFRSLFNPKMKRQEVQQIKEKQFKVLKVLKYKFR